MEKKYQQHHIPTVSEIKQTQTVHYDYKYIKFKIRLWFSMKIVYKLLYKKKTFEKCIRLCILPVLKS